MSRLLCAFMLSVAVSTCLAHAASPLVFLYSGADLTDGVAREGTDSSINLLNIKSQLEDLGFEVRDQLPGSDVRPSAFVMTSDSWAEAPASAEDLASISSYLVQKNALVVIVGDAASDSGATPYHFVARVLGYKGEWRACAAASSPQRKLGRALPSELAATFFSPPDSGDDASQPAEWPAALEDAPAVSFRPLCSHEDPAAWGVPLYSARGEPSEVAVQAFGKAGVPGTVVWLGYGWQSGQQTEWGELLDTLIRGFESGAQVSSAALSKPTGELLAGAAATTASKQQESEAIARRRRLQEESPPAPVGEEVSPSPPPPVEEVPPSPPPPVEEVSPSPPPPVEVPPSPPPPVEEETSSCPSYASSAVFVLGQAGMKPWGTKSIGPKFFPDKNASWIWSYPNAQLGTTPNTPPNPTFFTTVTVDSAQTAYLHIIVDANAEILLNGERVAGVWCGWGGGLGIDAYKGRPIALQLQEGANTLSLRCSSTKGSSGLLASLYAADKTTLLARTDSTWQYYNTGVVTLLGAAGSARWGKANINRNAFSDGKAQWIWTNAADDTTESPTFLLPYHVNKAKDALLHVMAENLAEIYLNGQLVRSVTNGWRTGEYTDRPISVDLVAGTNFFAIRVTPTSAGSTGGLLVSLQGGDGKSVFMRSGADWTYVYASCLP